MRTTPVFSRGLNNADLQSQLLFLYFITGGLTYVCVGRQMFISVIPRVLECHVGSVPRDSHGILAKAFCLFLSTPCFYS